MRLAWFRCCADALHPGCGNSVLHTISARCVMQMPCDAMALKTHCNWCDCHRAQLCLATSIKWYCASELQLYVTVRVRVSAVTSDRNQQVHVYTVATGQHGTLLDTALTALGIKAGKEAITSCFAGSHNTNKCSIVADPDILIVITMPCIAIISDLVSWSALR
jgi:hypothetical protein